jgi:hypothetical protein
MQVLTNYACKHTEFDTVAYSPALASANFRSIDGPCSFEECQSKFASKVKSELQLAGMSCESALRRFGNVEPMLAEELTTAGCTPDVVKALLNCSHRSAATTTYLCHYQALGLLAKFESCANKEDADQEEVNSLATQLSVTNRTIQDKTSVLKSAVCRLTKNGFPAPAQAFPMIQGIQTHKVSWGKAELAALKSTDEGQAILPLTLNSENILAAKSCILRVNAQLATYQASETTSSHANSSQAMPTAWANRSFSDIKLLRPKRVNARKLALARNRMTVNMGLVNAYSGKPYDQLSDPWWANKV